MKLVYRKKLKKPDNLFEYNKSMINIYLNKGANKCDDSFFVTIQYVFTGSLWCNNLLKPQIIC